MLPWRRTTKQGKIGLLRQWTVGHCKTEFRKQYLLCNLLKGGHSRSSCHGQGCYRWRHDHCTGCCLCIRYPQRTFWDACYDVFLFISCLPAAFVTMVTIRAVVVFSALWWTFVIDTGLKKIYIFWIPILAPAMGDNRKGAQCWYSCQSSQWASRRLVLLARNGTWR